MPFEAAKQIVAKEFDASKVEIDKEAKASFDGLRGILTYQQGCAEEWIKQLTYPGKEDDKRLYLFALQRAINEVVKDKKVTKEEMSALSTKLENDSNDLRENMVNLQESHERLLFKKTQDDAILDIRKADFQSARTKWATLEKSLSPLNRTNSLNNPRAVYVALKDPGLRVDMKIKEELIQITDLESFNKNLIKKGSLIDWGKDGERPDYIMENTNGEVLLGKVYWDNGLKSKKTEKVNWLDLLQQIQSDDLKVFKATRIENDGVTDFKEFTFEESAEQAKEKQDMALFNLLRQINEIYNFKGLDKVQGKEKEILIKGINKNLADHSDFFVRDGGIVRPTEKFLKLDPDAKKDILTSMLNGVNKYTQSDMLDLKIEKEKQPHLKEFYKAEKHFNNGDFIHAYALYKYADSLIGKAPSDTEEQREENLKLSQTIASRLYQVSFQVLDIAEQSLLIEIQEGDHMNGGFQEYYKRDLEHIRNVRKLLQNDKTKTQSLDTILNQINPDWKKPGNMTINFRPRQVGHFLPEQKKSYPLKMGYHFTLDRMTALTDIKEKDDGKKLEKRIYDGLMAEVRNAKTIENPRATYLVKITLGPELSKHRKDIIDKEWFQDKIKEIRKKVEKDRDEYYKSAYKIAVKIIGKEKYEKLPAEEKKKLQEAITLNLIQNQTESEIQAVVFKNYIEKYKGKDSAAAAEYIKYTNYFDDWRPWKWSAKGWAKVGEEIFINGLIMAATGGLGGFVGELIALRATVFIASKCGAKVAAHLATRIAVGAAAFTANVATFDTSYRSIQYMRGDKEAFKDYQEGLKHSARTLAVMHMGGKVFAPIIKKLTPYGKMTAAELTQFQSVLQRAVPRTISAVGVEAPLLMGLSLKYDKNDNRSAYLRYLTALRDIGSIGIGRKVINSTTNNFLPNFTTKMQVKSQIIYLKGSKNPAQVAKGRMLEEMMRKGELPVETIAQLTQSDLTAQQIFAMRNFMKNPQNQKFLLALKAALNSAEASAPEVKSVEVELVKALSKAVGIPISKALGYIKRMTLTGLVTVYEGAKKVGHEVAQYSKEAAKEFLITNRERIKKFLENHENLKAFVMFFKNFKGNYQEFLAKNPRLAKHLPQDFIQLGVLSIGVISVVTGNIWGAFALGVLAYKPKLRVGAVHYIQYGLSGTNKMEEARTRIVEINEANKTVTFYDYRHKRNETLAIDVYVELVRNSVESTRSEAERIQHYEDMRQKLISGGMHEVGDIFSLENHYKSFTYEGKQRDISTFENKLSLLFEINLNLNRLKQLQAQIEFLAPEYKSAISELTHFNAGAGNVKFPTFQARFERAVELLNIASRFKGMNISPENGKKLMEVIERSSTQDLIKELAENYGGNPATVKNKLVGLWRKLVALFRTADLTLSYQNAEKILENEIRNEGKNLTQMINGTNDLFSVHPVEKTPPIEKTIEMAEFFKVYESLDYNYRANSKLPLSEIFNEVVRRNPQLQNLISTNQRELIMTKLYEIRKILDYTESIKNASYQEQYNFVRNEILKVSPNCRVPGINELQFKLAFGNITGHITIYLTEEMYTKWHFLSKNPEKGWTRMAVSDREKAMRDDWTGGLNVSERVSFIKKIENYEPGGDKHEESHALSRILGTTYPNLWDRAYKHFHEGRYNEFLKMRFLKTFLDFSDEIIAFTKEGRGTPKYILKVFDEKYAEYYSPKLDYFPVSAAKKIMPEYVKLQKELRNAIIDAIHVATKTTQFPNGFNMMRLTSPTKWRQLYERLRTSPIPPVRVNKPASSGYDLLHRDVQKSLETPGKSIVLNNIQYKTVKILLSAPNNQTLVLLITRGTKAGYEIKSANNPDVEYKGLWDGKYVKFGREQQTNERFNFPDTVSREHFHIVRKGDSIEIINASNVGITVSTY